MPGACGGTVQPASPTAGGRPRALGPLGLGVLWKHVPRVFLTTALEAALILIRRGGSGHRRPRQAFLGPLRRWTRGPRGGDAPPGLGCFVCGFAVMVAAAHRVCKNVGETLGPSSARRGRWCTCYPRPRHVPTREVWALLREAASRGAGPAGSRGRSVNLGRVCLKSRGACSQFVQGPAC